MSIGGRRMSASAPPALHLKPPSPLDRARPQRMLPPGGDHRHAGERQGEEAIVPAP
jgi:hypothetical protein